MIIITLWYTSIFDLFALNLISTAAFYTVRTAEPPSSANGDEQNGHPTNVEDLYSTVNKKCEYQY